MFSKEKIIAIFSGLVILPNKWMTVGSRPEMKAFWFPNLICKQTSDMQTKKKSSLNEIFDGDIWPITHFEWCAKLCPWNIAKIDP